MANQQPNEPVVINPPAVEGFTFNHHPDEGKEWFQDYDEGYIPHIYWDIRYYFDELVDGWMRIIGCWSIGEEYDRAEDIAIREDEEQHKRWIDMTLSVLQYIHDTLGNDEYVFDANEFSHPEWFREQVEEFDGMELVEVEGEERLRFV